MYDAAVLFSGGIDSTYLLASLIKDGKNPFAILVDYNQPHKVELEKAKQICFQLGVDYVVIDLPSIGKVNDVVFSARNMLLISNGCMVASTKGIKSLYIGCNKSDFERFDDCRDDFLSAMKTACGTYCVSLHYPLVYLEKSEIITLLKELDSALYKMTWTCYSPKLTNGSYEQCGECYSCKGVKNAENIQS